MAAEDVADRFREIPLNGRLRTADDDAELVSQNGVVDFKTFQNVRYTDSHPQGIGGFTKINTNALSNVKIKNAFHFKKAFPVAESHVLVRALDSSSLNQKVFRQSTTIPGTGDFTSAALFTDATGYGTGQFSTAPGDKVMYCNGKDTAIWGGTEIPPLAYLDMAADGTYKYDYSEQVKNALTDSDNLATIHVGAGALDAATMLLLHLDNNVTDSSPTTVHTVTNANATFSTSVKKFGTHAAVFNGSSAQLSVPDDADFDFSAGSFTIDYWIKFTSTTGTQVVFHQGTDASNYIRISYTSGMPKLQVVAAASVVVEVYPGRDFSPTNWHHYAWVESGDSWYLFVDGVLATGIVTDTSRAADYTGVAYIGSSGAANYFNGTIDEFRISNSARWTSTFDPPTSAYGTTDITSLYISSPMPLQGIKAYVETVNTGAGSLSVFYWDSTFSWADASATDGTAVGGVPLAQDGSITFASTASTAYPRVLDDILAYWYKIEITNCDATTTISQITLDAPMQQVKELWDGLHRPIASFQKYASSKYTDYTLNVFKDSWTAVGTGTAADASTMVELDSLATATDAIFVGFMRRQTGLRLNLIGGHTNTTAGTVATISYANGVGPTTGTTAWTSVGTLDDQTMTGGISFSKSGTITWNPPPLASEFKSVIGLPSTETATVGVGHMFFGNTGTPVTTTVKKSTTEVKSPMYWYKIQFSANLSSDVQLYFVGGIPAQEDIYGYKFTTEHAGRTWYWGDERQPNRFKASALNAPQVVNGDDTLEDFLGDATAPVVGRSLFERFGSTTTNVQIICKPTQTWAIVGETLENFRPFLLSDGIGCTAPLTMDVGTVEFAPGLFKRAAIWQGQSGIYMSAGDSPQEVSNDIRDKFDPKHANYLTAAVLATCTGWIDQVYNEYHWVIPGSTDWVYDIRRKRWSEAPKASKIHCGVAVSDTSGIPYSYGFTATGFIERLEYGTTFDGTAIAHVLQFGDVAPTGSITDRTELRSIRLVGKAKETTTQAISVSHYGDSSTTASVPTITAISMSNSGKRLFNVFRSLGIVALNHIFHSLKFSVSTSDETVGFEPIYAVLGYKVVGKDKR